jgi:hypothetical protein
MKMMLITLFDKQGLIHKEFELDGKTVIRSALFWDIMWHCVVIFYRRFGTTYWSHLQGSRVREENVGKQLPHNAQESAVLINIVVEA